MSRFFRVGFLVIVAVLVLACSSDMTGNQEVAKAEAYLAEGRNNAAVIELKNALQKNGNNQQARWLLGEYYFSEGAYANAEKELKAAHELGQSDSDVLPLLAQAHLSQNQFESLQELSVETLSGADLSMVLASQGLGLLARGQEEEAALLIDKAISAAPELPYALVAQAKLKGTQSDGDWTQARRLLGNVFDQAPEYAPALSLLGDIELQSLNLDAAETAYSKALASDDDRFEDRYKRALVRLQKEDNTGASEDVAVLIRRSPKSPAANYLQGILHFRKGDMTAATGAFDLAQTDGDRYPMSLFYLATAHDKLGNSAQAEDFAYRYLSIAPDSAPGRKLLANMKLREGEGAEAEELMRAVVEASPEDVDALNLLSGALIKQGKTEEALTLLAKVASLQPDSPEAQARLGAGLLASGQVASSFEHIEAALKLDPEFEQADILLVTAYLKEGDVDGALAAVEAFEQKMPDSAAPHNLRGQVYLSQDKPAEAKTAFNQALTVAPDDVTANDKLALLSIRDNDLDTARGYYQKILEVLPDNLPTLMKLAALAELEKDDQGIEESLKRAMEAHPKATQPRVVLARYYLTKGEPQQVPNLLNTLDPASQNNPEVLNVKGLSLLARNDFSAARSTFEQLIALRSDAPQPHYHLGMTYRGLNDVDKEKAEFEKALQISPGYIEPRIELTRIFLREKDQSAVEENLTILKRLAPENAEVMQLEAVYALEGGDRARALELSEKVFAKAPTSRNMLFLAQQHWLAGDRDAAEGMMTDWLSEHPKDVAVRHELASLYVGKGEEGKAVEQYHAALQDAPESVVVLNNLAWLLRDSDPEKALDHAEKAVDLSDRSPSTLDTLAIVQLKNNQLVKAQRSIERALADGKGSPAMYYHSAMIDHASGNAEAAIQTLQRLLSEKKDFSERAEAEKLLATLTAKN